MLIAGGAVMGSSVALFLKRLAPACTVAVVEPDDLYEFASTLRASGGARRLFSCPENIAMSNFSLGFISRQELVGLGEKLGKSPYGRDLLQVAADATEP